MNTRSCPLMLRFDDDAVASHGFADAFETVRDYTVALFCRTLTTPQPENPVDQLSQRAYIELWHVLGRQLDKISADAGLGAALLSLHRHQVQTGFIQDDLSEIRRFRLACPSQPERAFSAQYNPARARRFTGAAAVPANDPDLAIHGGCFLCAENIWWQHQGAEAGYHLAAAGGRYTAWMNPFPLLPAHTVIASREHWPQHWQTPGALSLEEMIRDLVALASLLPDWITFYNGVGAGASIPHHLHFHAMPRAPGYEEMPLEAVVREHPAPGRVDRDYPMSFMHWAGKPRQVLERALDWLAEWQLGAGAETDATANVIACAHSGSEALDLYFIPRHQSRSRAEGLAGVIGGFEALGEIVCSSAQDLARLESGEVDYRTVAGLLSQVSVAF